MIHLLVDLKIVLALHPDQNRGRSEGALIRGRGAYLKNFDEYINNVHLAALGSLSKLASPDL